MADLRDELADIGVFIQRFIQESLAEPELAAKSQEFRDGYTRGFTEASVAFVVSKVKKMIVPVLAPVENAVAAPVETRAEGDA